jgi:hypothetical protein
MQKSSWDDFFDADPSPVRLRRSDSRPQKRLALVARGAGNVYRDLGHSDADVKQLKALLAAEILKTLDRTRMEVPSCCLFGMWPM